jgi:L-ascorbate metabolism protein UlaG (beta-lactamase superfamily)
VQRFNCSPRNVLAAAGVLMLLGSLAACSDDESDGDAGQQSQTATGGTSGSSAAGGAQDMPTSGQGGMGSVPTGGQPAQDSGAAGGPIPQDSGAGDGRTAQDSAAADSQAAQDSGPSDSQTGADAPGSDAVVDAGPNSNVTIHYWVQSCFSMAVEGGVSVVIDPYTPSPTIEPDVVMVTHEHPDHNNVEGVPGTFEVIRPADGVGEHQVAGITFTVVPTFHDDAGGSLRGPNNVFAWEMEGIRFAHLGDLGHLLTDEQIAQIGAVDVLMIPTGGTATIDGPTAVQVVQQLSAKLIIPMHYQLFGGVGPFLDAVPAEWIVEQPGSASITVNAADFTADGVKVVVLVP